MDNRIIQKPFLPITTGAPAATQSAKPQGEESAFSQLLRDKIAQNSSLNFSRHAVNRVAERSLEISESSLQRLDEGMRIAKGKGLDDTLILVDDTAFIVSAKNNTVITAVNSEDLRGNVFTNIQGAVII